MPNSRFQVIVLIKHGLYEPFIELAQQGQGSTFLQRPIDPRIKVIHFYGIPGGRVIQQLDRLHEFLRFKNRLTNIILQMFDYVISLPFLFWVPKVVKSNELSFEDDEFQCKVIDTLLTLRWKQLAVYKYVLANFKFDYVYDTNVSSYLDFENLLLQVQEFSVTPLYAGNLPLNTFVSGANRFYDEGALRTILQNKYRWSPSILEDVAIGRLMNRCSITPVTTNSLSITSIEELNKLPDEIIIDNYHFRVKSYSAGRRNDAVIMQALKFRFSKIRAGR
jgi:hypothetical protein